MTDTKIALDYYKNKIIMRKELQKTKELPQNVCQESFELGWERAIGYYYEE